MKSFTQVPQDYTCSPAADPKERTQWHAQSTFQFIPKQPKENTFSNSSTRQLQATQDRILNSLRLIQLAQLQAKMKGNPARPTSILQKKENRTGLPDNLKSGIENLSGYSMDDVKVHYNSDKPAQLQAHAYAQGTDIHLGPSQEKYLPHEAWHVVQQKQGRVKPTVQMKGSIPVNDEVRLETEADTMGNKAHSSNTNSETYTSDIQQLKRPSKVHQLAGNPPWPKDFSISTSALIMRFELKPNGDKSTPNDYEVESIEAIGRPPVFLNGVRHKNQGQHKVAYIAIVTALQQLRGHNLSAADTVLDNIITTSEVPFSDLNQDIEVALGEKSPKAADDLVKKAHNYLAARQADDPSWPSTNKDQLVGKGESELTGPLIEWQELKHNKSKKFVQNFLQKPVMKKLFDATGRDSDEWDDAEGRAFTELKIHNKGLVDRHKNTIKTELRKYRPKPY